MPASRETHRVTFSNDNEGAQDSHNPGKSHNMLILAYIHYFSEGEHPLGAANAMTITAMPRCDKAYACLHLRTRFTLYQFTLMSTAAPHIMWLCNTYKCISHLLFPSQVSSCSLHVWRTQYTVNNSTPNKLRSGYPLAYTRGMSIERLWACFKVEALCA